MVDTRSDDIPNLTQAETDITRLRIGLERSHLYKKCQHLGIELRAGR